MTVVVHTPDQQVSEGDELDLSATVSNADSIMWTGQGSFDDATDEDPIWTAPAATPNDATYRLTCTGTRGSTSRSDYVDITVQGTGVDPCAGKSISVADMTVAAGGQGDAQPTTIGFADPTFALTTEHSWITIDPDDGFTFFDPPDELTPNLYTYIVMASGSGCPGVSTVGRVTVEASTTTSPPTTLPPVAVVVHTPDQQVSEGDELDLSATVSNADSIMWTGQGSFDDATDEDPIWTAPAATPNDATYRLTCTGTRGSTSRSDYVDITVQGTGVDPCIGKSVSVADVTVAAGGQGDVTPTTIGFADPTFALTTEHSWITIDPDDGFISFDPPDELTLNLYTYTVTASGSGCPGVSAIGRVTAGTTIATTSPPTTLPPPVAVVVHTPDQQVSEGDELDLSATVSNADSIMWTGQGSFDDATDEDPIWTAPAATPNDATYRLTCTGTRGSTSRSDYVDITVQGTGVDPCAGKSISVADMTVAAGGQGDAQPTTIGFADPTFALTTEHSWITIDPDDGFTFFDPPDELTPNLYTYIVMASGSGCPGVSTVGRVTVEASTTTSPPTTLPPVAVVVHTPDQQVSEGDELDLSATVSNADSIMWTGQGSFDDATDEDPIWTAPAATPNDATYRLTCTGTRGSTSRSDYVDITVQGTGVDPCIGKSVSVADVTVAAGGQGDVTPTTIGFADPTFALTTEHSWITIDPDDGFISFDPPDELTLNLYTYTVTASGSGCPGVSAIGRVTAGTTIATTSPPTTLPPPVAVVVHTPDQQVSEGDELDLSATVSNADSIMWTGQGSFDDATDEDPIWTAPAATPNDATYRLTCTGTRGSTSRSDYVDITVQGTGVDPCIGKSVSVADVTVAANGHADVTPTTVGFADPTFELITQNPWITIDPDDGLIFFDPPYELMPNLYFYVVMASGSGCPGVQRAGLVTVTTAAATTSPPSTEQPSTEQPSTEQPSTEQPSTEQPSTEQPSTEQPSTEQPSTEQPSTEQPSTEQPSTEQPSTEQPSTEQPSTEQPTTDPPTTDSPTTDSPTTDPPTTETPTSPPSTSRPVSLGTPGGLEYEYDGLTVTLSWNSVSGALSYDIDYDDVAGVPDDNVSGTSRAVGAQGSDYSFRVRARSGDSVGRWSNFLFVPGTGVVTTSPPTTETPTTDPPTTDSPTTDPPTTETPTTDPPTTDSPTTDQPSTEQPSTEQPSTEQPSTEQPSTEQPSTEQPSTDQPSTEQPSTEQPSTEQPSTEQPSTEQPSTEQPSTEQPSTEQPSTEQPSTEQPSTEQPSTDPPSTDPPSTDPPSTDPPSTDPPSTDPPSTDPPSTDPPSTDPPPTTDTPTTEPPGLGPANISSLSIIQEDLFGSVTLTADAQGTWDTISFLWSNGSTGESIVVAESSGTHTVTATATGTGTNARDGTSDGATESVNV